VRLAWATDIHWNFARPEAKERFFAQLVTAKADALLLTGDNAEAPSYVSALQELRDTSGLQVYHVAGNHDFHGSSIAVLRGTTLAGDGGYLTNRVCAVEFGGYSLAGVDGWYDVTHGRGDRSPVMLADFSYVTDLMVPHAERVRRLRRVARRDAERLSDQLSKARSSKILVALHVPPFPGAAWHMGKLSDADFVPYFSSSATGDALADYARAHPGVELLVLCGHCHSSGSYRHAPNLRVLTGHATYGHPEIQGIIVDGTTFEAL